MKVMTNKTNHTTFPHIKADQNFGDTSKSTEKLATQIPGQRERNTKMRNRGHNLKNAAIAFLVPIPSILFYTSFLKHSNNNETHSSPLWSWCIDHPLLLANALFFFNVNVLFWVVSQILSSHWMIDLYWTVIPVMLAHFYESHPLAKFNPWRSRAVILLTWLWSLRLTHNYFRREKWEWGSREDWRFTDMKAQYGKHWWWVSFFAVYASQQVFLIGVCLPLYAIHSSEERLSSWDLVAGTACLAGIATAFFADTQLHEFVRENERLAGIGEACVANLETGLWKYSRHPNYFGEQLWWWGLFLFAWGLGGGWTFVGPLANSMCLAYVTKLVEDRMLNKAYRAKAYRLYQRTTSVLIPWPKSSSSSLGPQDKDN